MANNTKATPSPEELLIQRESDVTARETSVKEREDALLLKEQEFETKTLEIQNKEELYSANESELETLRAEVEEMRSELEKAQAAPAKVVPGLKFEFEGESYKFRDKAPKSIRIDGLVVKQKDLIKDKDSLLQLVAGNSGLIEKIQ